ncbi:hypothetical protein COU93_01615, partial [Candidatus Shapirobacteria bacterium CG10_big_fil_rev_8_21_14_0_10_36_6]
MVYKNLTDVLVAHNYLTTEVAEKINLERLKSGESEEEIILQKRLLSDLDFAKVKAEFLRVPFVNLEEIGFAPEALAL